MNGENRLLVTDEPVEVENQPVEVQDFKRITHHFRELCRTYLINEENPKDRNM